MVRPRGWPEAIWASVGAVLFVMCGLLPASQALIAIGKGTDVYLFLAGMMLLAELARREGVFDWMAGLAVKAAKGSGTRFFTLIFLVGTAVTVLLSNDATAVVLTPAVYAAVRRARVKVLPYLLVCAFIANAASFVLPISNPANLVVYGAALPPLWPWMRTFLAPSLCAIAVTYFCLRWMVRADLLDSIESEGEPVVLTEGGQRAAWGIAGTGAILMASSAMGCRLGLPTLLAAAVSVLLATKAGFKAMREVVQSVSGSVLPLVAGLFVVVEGLNKAGAVRDVAALIAYCVAMPKLAGALAASFGVAALSNLMNNLPAGLLAGEALRVGSVPAHIRDAILIGVDLGPNLSVTGSLATVLWLIAIRREGEQVSAWQFLRVGALAMPPALLLAVLSAQLFR